MALNINEAELREVIGKLDKVLEAQKKPAEQRRILRRIARKTVVPAAQAAAPVGKRVHYQYDTPKLIQSRRAKRGYGVKKATYQPGNLAKSIDVLPLRKSSRTFIGPKIQRKVNMGDVFGPGTGKFNAYYAQFIYGSALAFKQRIMIPALNASAPAIIQAIKKSIDTRIKRLAKQQRLGRA